MFLRKSNHMYQKRRPGKTKMLKFKQFLNEMTKGLIIVDIPSNKKSLQKALKYVGDNTWDKSNIDDWVNSDVNYIFFDRTRGDYNYTNYETDGHAQFFVKKGLKKVNFKEIK